MVRFGVPSTVHSEGSLSLPDPGTPAMMEVDWDTGILANTFTFSDMEYVVLHTDYTTRALVCSCHHLNLGFFAVNRRSCDYMIVSKNMELSFVLLRPSRDPVRSCPALSQQTTPTSWTPPTPTWPWT